MEPAPAVHVAHEVGVQAMPSATMKTRGGHGVQKPRHQVITTGESVHEREGMSTFAIAAVLGNGSRHALGLPAGR